MKGNDQEVLSENTNPNLQTVSKMAESRECVQ